MAWNEPPGGNNDKDPWGNPKKGNDGPPDLDEVFKKVNEKVTKMFGGKGGGSNNNSGGSGLGGIFAIAGIVLVAFLVMNSFYTVDERERGVVLRLGKFHQVTEPGLKFKIPLIDQVERVSVTDIRNYSKRSQMLTQDQNIVEVALKVQWRAADAKSFALNVQNPSRVLEHATEAALRHVVGATMMEQVLTQGRQQLVQDVKLRLQQSMDSYGTGIVVSQVNLEDAKAPSEVQAAYDDVVKAGADEERFKNEAQAYANQIIPQARGLAQRQIEEANAYKEEIIAKAEGEADRFNRLYTEYEKAPDVTRKRLYLETISKIYGSSNKVLVDVEGGNNMMYLPLDQLGKNRGSLASPEFNTGSASRNDSDISRLTDEVIEEFRRRGIIRQNSN